MMNDYLKMIDELLLIKASVQLLDTTNQKVKTDLLDYIDTLIAEYNGIIERYEEDMKNEYERVYINEKFNYDIIIVRVLSYLC